MRTQERKEDNKSNIYYTHSNINDPGFHRTAKKNNLYAQNIITGPNHRALWKPW